MNNRQLNVLFSEKYKSRSYERIGFAQFYFVFAIQMYCIFDKTYFTSKIYFIHSLKL
jgi:hypothetical protein